jgi:hypothetical protein
MPSPPLPLPTDSLYDSARDPLSMHGVEDHASSHLFSGQESSFYNEIPNIDFTQDTEAIIARAEAITDDEDVQPTPRPGHNALSSSSPSQAGGTRQDSPAGASQVSLSQFFSLSQHLLFSVYSSRCFSAAIHVGSFRTGLFVGCFHECLLGCAWSRPPVVSRAGRHKQELLMVGLSGTRPRRSPPPARAGRCQQHAHRHVHARPAG